VALGYSDALYILAFDHRGSFQKKLFGISTDPTPQETERISDAKEVIFDGFRRALDEGAPREAAAILVDEQFGSRTARSAKAAGIRFAMPVEKSGQDEFDFEYGEGFATHIEDFDPDFAKVLVRWNPEGDVQMNRRQGDRLARLSEWLHERGRRLLFELLVPAEPGQLASVGGDEARYDRELRPGLMRRAIEELQASGVEPDVWKIEGLDRRQDCEAVARQARTGERDEVACVVLGRGANEAQVLDWLRAGAGVPGYVGFAIGRTIWWDGLTAYVAGSSDRAQAAAGIAATFRRMIDAYRDAAARVPLRAGGR
jgi:myo-inositol catabolism protein IolC